MTGAGTVERTTCGKCVTHEFCGRHGCTATIYTEAKAVAFLTGTRLPFFRTGSREVCDPAPTDTDVDFVMLVPEDWNSLDFDNAFERAGFRNTSREHADTYESRNAPIETYRCGEVNLIVTWDRFTFGNWRGATSIAKRLNLLDKGDRIALFQGVLYCNWADWLVRNHAQEF